MSFLLAGLGLSGLKFLVGAGAAVYQKEERNRQADQAIQISKEKADDLYNRQKWVKKRTEDEVQEYGRNLYQVQSTLRQRVGAAGLRMGGSAEAIYEMNVETGERDVNRIKLAGQYEVDFLDREANAILLHGQRTAEAYRRQGNAELLNGLLGTGISALEGINSSASTASGINLGTFNTNVGSGGAAGGGAAGMGYADTGTLAMGAFAGLRRT